MNGDLQAMGNIDVDPGTDHSEEKLIIVKPGSRQSSSLLDPTSS